MHPWSNDTFYRCGDIFNKVRDEENEVTAKVKFDLKFDHSKAFDYLNSSATCFDVTDLFKNLTSFVGKSNSNVN